ncbi:MAG: flagellar hook-basal body complex protein FliE [Planctomycetes bacterium]|nr:flagellar hook-basal body complex protein FliE [Planctomycetota bacterium]
MDPIQEYALRNAMDSAMARGKARPGVTEVGKNFAELFENLVGGANEMNTKAKASVEGLLTGEVDNIHEVMVAVNKADLSFRFLVEIRNKLQEAYKDLMSQSR